MLIPDEAQWVFPGGYEKIYVNCLKTAQAMGTVKQENKAAGVIKASIEGADVTLRVSKLSSSRVGVAVAARKLWFPRPDLASRVLYAVEEKMR